MSSTKVVKSGTSQDPKSLNESENRILEAILSLQGTIKKQTEKMNDHEKKISEQNKQLQQFASTLAAYEDYDHSVDYEYDDYCEQYDDQLCDKDDGKQSDVGSMNPSGSATAKRPVEEDENNNSRFKAMSKRFKASEPVDSEIDGILAQNVTELFRNGIDESRYSD